MALIDNLKDAVRSHSESDLLTNTFIVVTQAQYDAMKADAYRADAPDLGLYRPDGSKASRASFTTGALLGTPVLIREVGESTLDITAPFLDLRDIT